MPKRNAAAMDGESGAIFVRTNCGDLVDDLSDIARDLKI